MKCPECEHDIKKHQTFGCIEQNVRGNRFCLCGKGVDELIDLLQAERDEAVRLLRLYGHRRHEVEDFLASLKE